MAYLHCHKCGWSQDDFWDFGFSKYGYTELLPGVAWKYNPISLFISHCISQKWWKYFYPHALLIPRRIDHQEDVIEYYGWKRKDPHSWWLIWYHFKRMCSRLYEQKYWTEQSWKRAIKKNNGKWPCCPKCGTNELDID